MASKDYLVRIHNGGEAQTMEIMTCRLVFLTLSYTNAWIYLIHLYPTFNTFEEYHYVDANKESDA